MIYLENAKSDNCRPPQKLSYLVTVSVGWAVPTTEQ